MELDRELDAVTVSRQCRGYQRGRRSALAGFIVIVVLLQIRFMMSFFFSSGYSASSTFSQNEDDSFRGPPSSTVTVGETRKIVHRPRPIWQGKAGYPSVYYDLSNVSTSDCLNFETVEGWGNSIFLLFYSLLTHESQDFSRPCIERGARGDIFTSIFQNIPTCDPDWHQTMHCTPIEPDVPRGSWGNEIYPSLKDRSAAPFLQRYLALNRSYVVNKLFQGSSEQMDLIRRSCAVQVRFGDTYFRPPEALAKKTYADMRIKCDVRNMDSCYKRVARWVDKVCPHKEDPIFVSSDLLNFTQFLIDSRPNRYIWKTNHSQLESSRTSVHTGDLTDNQFPTALLQDWISFGLANQSYARSRSTFADTATLGFYLGDAR
jgi:hypothetical protein